jgi:hypothetical protein
LENRSGFWLENWCGFWLVIGNLSCFWEGSEIHSCCDFFWLGSRTCSCFVCQPGNQNHSGHFWLGSRLGCRWGKPWVVLGNRNRSWHFWLVNASHSGFWLESLRDFQPER